MSLCWPAVDLRIFFPVQTGKEYSWKHGGSGMAQRGLGSLWQPNMQVWRGALWKLCAMHPPVRHQRESRSGAAVGKLSPGFPLGRSKVPVVEKALKKGRREGRQDHGKLGEEQAKQYICCLCPCGGNLVVILDSSWEAALIPAFAISCQAHAPNLPSVALSEADRTRRSCQHQSR